MQGCYTFRGVQFQVILLRFNQLLIIPNWVPTAPNHHTHTPHTHVHTHTTHAHTHTHTHTHAHTHQHGGDVGEPLEGLTDVRQPGLVQQDLLQDEGGDRLRELAPRLHYPQAEGDDLCC